MLLLKSNNNERLKKKLKEYIFFSNKYFLGKIKDDCGINQDYHLVNGLNIFLNPKTMFFSCIVKIQLQFHNQFLNAALVDDSQDFQLKIFSFSKKMLAVTKMSASKILWR